MKKVKNKKSQKKQVDRNEISELIEYVDNFDNFDAAKKENVVEKIKQYLSMIVKLSIDVEHSKISIAKLQKLFGFIAEKSNSKEVANDNESLLASDASVSDNGKRNYKPNRNTNRNGFDDYANAPTLQPSKYQNIIAVIAVLNAVWVSYIKEKSANC